jgi:hypothetical protein
MMVIRDILCVLMISATGLLLQTAWADDKGKVQVITDWTEDEQPIRIDCHDLPIVGNGIGGAQLSCADRLSLYSLFSCYPMKKDVVEAFCPEWEGLKADVDWDQVAELIDIRAAKRATEEAKKILELDQLSLEYKEHLESER